MNHAKARLVDDCDLSQHGISRAADRAVIQSRERASGAVLMLTLSGSSTELLIDTASAYPDHSVFAFVEAEAMWAKLDGEPWVETGSGLVIAPNGITRHLRWSSTWRFVAAIVPRAAIASFVPALPPGATVYSDRRLLDTSMELFVSNLLEAEGRASAIEQYAIEQLVMEMSGALLLDRMGAVTGQGSPHEVLRDRAIAVIAQQCGDPSLNPVRVAREVQSSLRQLQLVFAEAGYTVAGEIRRHRARLAHSLLVDSRYDVLSIEQISQRAGFHSPMSLRRALDEAFQTTPRALRAGRQS